LQEWRQPKAFFSSIDDGELRMIADYNERSASGQQGKGAGVLMAER
jgi:hypothetical protein